MSGRIGDLGDQDYVLRGPEGSDDLHAWADPSGAMWPAPARAAERPGRFGVRRRRRVLTSLALMLLRISTGMLLVWWGVKRIRDPDYGVAVSDRFYMGLFSNRDLQDVFGHIETVIGMLVVLGLFRAVALPAQMAIVGFTVTMVWKAMFDPFGIIVDSPPMAQFFYPSSVICCAALTLLVVRRHDRWALDHYFLRYVDYMRARQAQIASPAVIPPPPEPMRDGGLVAAGLDPAGLGPAGGDAASPDPAGPGLAGLDPAGQGFASLGPATLGPTSLGPTAAGPRPGRPAAPVGPPAATAAG
ncbi:MAG: hypothetical protein AAF677_17080 [Pseudomonadota bacterium]